MTLLRAVGALVSWGLLPAVAGAATIGTRDVTTGSCPSDGRGGEPDPLDAEVFLARAVGCGALSWLVGAALLARLGALSARPVWAIAAALTAGAVTALAGPARPGLRVWRRRRARASAALALGAVAVGGAVLAAVVVSGWETLRQPTPWLYWQLAREVASTGGVPATSFEWGRAVPFLHDYPAFTAGTALVAVAGGDTVRLGAAGLVQLTAIGTLGIGGFLLARLWGAGRIAAVAAVIGLFTLDVTATKLASLRPESLAYGLGLVSAALARQWLRARRPADLALAALTLAACFLTHPLAALLSAGVWAGTLTAALASRRDRRAAWALVPAVIGGWLTAIAVRGRGLAGAEKLGGSPRLTAGEPDPTWVFRQLSLGAPPERPPLSIWATARLALRRGFLDLPWWWFAAAAALVAAALALSALRRRGAPRAVSAGFLLLAAGTAATVIALSAVMAAGWDTYVPRRTGPWRLLAPLGMLVPIGAAVAAGNPDPTGADPGASAGRRARRQQRAQRVAARAGVALLVVAVLLAAATAPAVWRLGRLGPSTQRVAEARALSLPPGSLILANSYTDGFLRAGVGTPGLIEGRAPYTEARLLRRANRLLLDAQAFFADPAPDRRIPGAGVTHVLVATDNAWTLGTPVVMPTDRKALDRRPDLRLEATGAGFRLYRVRR